MNGDCPEALVDPLDRYFDTTDEGLGETRLRYDVIELDLTTARDDLRLDVGGWDHVSFQRVDDRATVKLASTDNKEIDVGVGEWDLRSVDRIYLSNPASNRDSPIIQIALLSGVSIRPSRDAVRSGGDPALQPTRFEAIQQTVSAEEQLSLQTASFGTVWIRIKADDGNSQDLVIGEDESGQAAPTSGFRLAPGEEVRLPVQDMEFLTIRSADGVTTETYMAIAEQR